MLAREDLLLAFRYFDTTGAGYIRVDDLRRLVDCLGHALNHTAVKALCQHAVVSFVGALYHNVGWWTAWATR